jgi:hypothetical protein
MLRDVIGHFFVLVYIGIPPGALRVAVLGALRPLGEARGSKTASAAPGEGVEIPAPRVSQPCVL